MHLRDRQAIIFSLFFPILFMLVLGFTSGKQNAIELGVVNGSHSELADQFIATLSDNPLFNITQGSEEALRTALIEGNSRMVLILPAAFRDTGSAPGFHYWPDAGPPGLVRCAVVDPARDCRFLHGRNGGG